MAVAGLFAIALVGLVAQPASAIHHGATIDCGSAGTYTIKTGDNGVSVFKPGFFQVDLLAQDGKVVGTLVPFQVSVNGQPIQFVGNTPDQLEDRFATCSFTGSNGDYFVLVGLLNLR
jgi:hypothetical protein